jgi:hypothetical protein
MSKDKYKVTNWKQYNEGLIKRGSISLWIEDVVLDNWLYSGTHKRGGKQLYSDLAIQTCLCLRKVYRLPLRQTQGFVQSIFKQSHIYLQVPDFTTISKRSESLPVDLSSIKNGNVTDIVVDSTGLKVYGEGEWKVRKHGAGKHRTWMKMHLAVDEKNQQIQAVTLTTNAVQDATEVKELLEQIDQPIGSFKGDGAYDKHKARRELFGRNIRQVIPPQRNAVQLKKKYDFLEQREEAIRSIEEIGRKEWKIQNDYHQRSKSETAMFRYKTIIGNNLSARKFKKQQTEVRIACKILNIFLQASKPVSRKIA